MSGFASGLFLLSNRSKESFGSKGGSCFSIQRSGIVNGLTQVIAFAGDASAVATALTLAVLMPKYLAISVSTGLPRELSRQTLARTRFAWPVGSSGNVMSSTLTLGAEPMTAFALPAAIAL